MTRPSSKREAILDCAEASVLAKGFGATSIEEIIAEVGVSKNGFFYHFADKNALARALLQRYLDTEDRVLDRVFAGFGAAGADPLETFLEGLENLARLMADLPSGHPGCLIATYAYSERMFDSEVRALNREAVLRWRTRFRAVFETIAGTHPPRVPVDLDDLADSVTATIEGGIVLSKAMAQPSVLPRQLRILKAQVALLFSGGT